MPFTSVFYKTTEYFAMHTSPHNFSEWNRHDQFCNVIYRCSLQTINESGLSVELLSSFQFARTYFSYTMLFESDSFLSNWYMYLNIWPQVLFMCFTQYTHTRIDNMHMHYVHIYLSIHKIDCRHLRQHIQQNHAVNH